MKHIKHCEPLVKHHVTLKHSPFAATISVLNAATVEFVAELGTAISTQFLVILAIAMLV